MTRLQQLQKTGIQRLGTPARGFRYRRADGRRVNAADLRRIDELKIPPAWTGVWIASGANDHLQATGRDARGRKQYRYHPRWRVVRDEAKYGRMLAFGQALPIIRAHTEEDIARPGLSRRKVLAAVIRLLRGQQPAPQAFDSVLTKQQVLKAVQPLIAS